MTTDPNASTSEVPLIPGLEQQPTPEEMRVIKERWPARHRMMLAGRAPVSGKNLVEAVREMGLVPPSTAASRSTMD